MRIEHMKISKSHTCVLLLYLEEEEKKEEERSKVDAGLQLREE
jgi:hypothetical protein